MIKIDGTSLRELSAAFDEAERRLHKLESASAVVLPTSAPRNPAAGQVWMDVPGGKINVWDGNGWTTYTKD